MSANLKLIPRAERLLEGKITADMTDSQTTVTVDNPPAIASLPSYLEIDPDSATYRELCRVVNVSSSTITLERGLNNGGTGFAHANNTSYKFKFTSRHWETVADALESGYLSEDSSYAFAQVSTSSFKITAATVDRTDLYTTGRKVRLNGTVILTVVSSSYSNPDTTIVVNGTTVPATITSVELAIATKGSTDIVTDNKASGTSVNAGLSESEIVTPKAIADSYLGGATSNLQTQISALPTASSTTTFTNKRIEPRIVTANSYTTDTGTSLSVATADVFQVTAQAGALKFNNPGGTPVAGQKLIIRIKDDGTARALTYDTQFRASTDLALPTTTVLGKTLYMGFIWNATDSKWDLLAVLNNF